MRLLGWVLMTNHFHLVLWPRRDGDLQAFMQWATTCHVRRYHKHYRGSGHVWQGRYRSFPIEPGGHLLTVLRYVERNPVRAGMVARAQDWLYSSAREMGSGSGAKAEVPDPFSDSGPGKGSGTFSARQTAPAGKGARPRGAAEPTQKLGQAPQPGKGSGTAAGAAEPDPFPLAHWLVEGPTPRPQPWLRFVNREEEAEQLAKLRECVNRGSPFGDDTWRKNAARKLGLESTIRPRGRPRKK